jgi:hypothetical protein
MFGYPEETLACSKEYKKRPRPTQGCRADDDGNEKNIISTRNQKE